MKYEYLSAQRTGRKTSGHESDDLAEFLNHYAADGWRMRQIIRQTDFQQLIIFERAKNE